MNYEKRKTSLVTRILGLWKTRVTGKSCKWNHKVVMSNNTKIWLFHSEKTVLIGSLLNTRILELIINTYSSLLISQKSCNWRTLCMKSVLIEFWGNILKNRVVTRNRVTGIRVTRGLDVYGFSYSKYMVNLEAFR